MFIIPTLFDNSKTFSNKIKQRLCDQNIQNVSSKLKSSKRFHCINTIKSDFGLSNYLKIIRNPEVRNIFTRIRADTKILNICKVIATVKKKQ